MTFKLKLNNVFDFLGCRNIDISNISNLDASIISRFRTGARIPKTNSENLIQLCKDITVYAEQNSKLDNLTEFCNIKKNISNDTFYKSLLLWFMSDESDVSAEHLPSVIVPFCNYSSKLNSVMSLLKISNIALAKAVNIDASLVSRFRNGSRKPSLKNSTALDICSYLLSRAYKSSHILELCEIIECPDNISLDDQKSILNIFFDWISDKNEFPEQNALLHLLNKFDEYSSYTENIHTENIHTENIHTEINLPIMISNTKPHCFHDIYEGIAGLKHCFLNFISSCYKSTSVDTIYLYSDFDFFLLFNDIQFKKNVFKFLHLLTEKKVTIYIIHTLKRTFLEVSALIEMWLPLYCTGYVKPFYHNFYYDGRFSHGLYVANTVGAISSTFVTNEYDLAEHSYFTSEHRINYFTKQFKSLLKSSNPFLIVHNLKSVNSYITYFSNLLQNNNEIILLQPTFTFHIVTDELLQQILYENNVDENTAQLYIDYKKFSQYFINLISSTNFQMYTNLIDTNLLPSSNELKFTDINKLLNNHKYLMLTMNTYNSINKTLYFSKETYMGYVDILKKLELKNNYHFKCKYITNTSFNNTSILLKKGISAQIHTVGSISTFLEIKHPLILDTIEKIFSNMESN